MMDKFSILFNDIIKRPTIVTHPIQTSKPEKLSISLFTDAAKSNWSQYGDCTGAN